MENSMKSAIFNENVYIEYPEDFYEMSGEEIRKFFAGNFLRFGVRNVEKHAIMSIAKTEKSLFTFIADAKSVLAGAERSLKKGLKDYVRTDSFDTVILGNAAKGIRFEYSAIDKNVRQFCEMTVVKANKGFYTVYCVARRDDAEEIAPTFEAFRSSLKFI